MLAAQAWEALRSVVTVLPRHHLRPRATAKAWLDGTKSETTSPHLHPRALASHQARWVAQPKSPNPYPCLVHVHTESVVGCPHLRLKMKAAAWLRALAVRHCGESECSGHAVAQSWSHLGFFLAEQQRTEL